LDAATRLEQVCSNPRDRRAVYQHYLPREAQTTMWSTIKAELELSPDEPTRPFYFRMRLIHDFPGSERQMAVFRAKLRRSGLAAAAIT
jgi:hypothetical protein